MSNFRIKKKPTVHVMSKLSTLSLPLRSQKRGCNAVIAESISLYSCMLILFKLMTMASL